MPSIRIQTPGLESGPVVSDAGLLDLARGPGAAPLPAIAAKRMKAREDTAAGCDDLAVSDLARAALADTANGRHKFERSAASWQQRAGLLQGIEDGLARRTAQSRAGQSRAGKSRARSAGAS
jgi:hypothetical protein